MLASRIETLNPSVTSDAFFKQKLVIGHDYNHLYDDVAALATNKLAVSEAATTVLTAADSGKVFFIDAATATTTFTLPVPAVGLHFKWIWVANSDVATVIWTADFTDTTGDMLRGGLLVHSAANLNTFVEASGDVNCLAPDDNVSNNAAGIGSWVEIMCVEDAVWFVTGIMNGTTDTDGNGSAIFSDQD